ncbi:glycosyltransferase [Paenibacillus sp. 481]|uniref:glycosyltransferase n=1 Tax=Paenibacillus sp. 481 TaxID=2835869 RepID=UPI001E415C21|nr:glycosyltransferase [Paenibacillus sp. 481]UHA75718.1 glycosyltransferase [Paenibacillus sp. 481]
MTRDEEDVIANCIHSIRPYVQEVLVLDTGSTDNTIHIAALNGAKVVSSDWEDHFASSRNKMIELASQPIILMLDADETVRDNLQQQFQQVVHELLNNSSLVGRIKIVNRIGDNEEAISSISRIFTKSNSIHYVGSVHEQLRLKDGSSPDVFDSNIIVDHEGYSLKRLKEKNKVKRNAELLLKELEINPSDVYALFQLGRTYAISEEHDKASYYLEKAYQLSNGAYSFDSTIIQTYGWTLLKTGQLSKLLQILQTGIGRYSDLTDLYYLYGCSLIEMKTEQALALIPQAFQSCLELGEVDSSKYETVLGVGTFRAHYNLGVYYEITGQYSLAKDYYHLSAAQQFQPAVQRLNLLVNK